MSKQYLLAASTFNQSYRWHSTNGLRIFFREAGPSDGPTLVLLHGYPSTSKMYASLIPFLAAARYHVIAPDYPGFGLSDAPDTGNFTYTFDSIAEIIGKFLTELGIERYVLFMQDYGGPIGFRIAHSNPERVEAIIIQNANAYEEGLGDKWKELSQYWIDPGAHPDIIVEFTSLDGARTRHLGCTPNPHLYNPETWNEEFQMLSRSGARAIQSALFYDYQNNVRAYPEWQAWLREQQPHALILWGRYDVSFVVPGAEAFIRDLPDAELHILDAGHFALDEATEEVAALVLDFLERKVNR